MRNKGIEKKKRGRGMDTERCAEVGGWRNGLRKEERNGKRKGKETGGKRQEVEGGMGRGRAGRGRGRRKGKGRGTKVGRTEERQAGGRKKEERSDRRKVRVLLYEGSPPLTKVIKNFHQKNYFPAEFPVEKKKYNKRSSTFHSFYKLQNICSLTWGIQQMRAS
jgi:hypothetical protein